jgi:hypothetical protein
LKYNTYAQGEQVHIAAWPCNNGPFVGHEPWSVCNEASEVTMNRAYSLDGQVFTLVTNQPVSPEGIKANSEGQANSKDSFMLSGKFLPLLTPFHLMVYSFLDNTSCAFSHLIHAQIHDRLP